MRILHTSDWHVGRTVRGRSRADEHREVLAEIAGIAHDREVDLILVAGDQFDTAAPSAEAESIVYRALLDLADTGAHVVVLAGNHDNPRRWAAVRPLLALGNVHLAERVARPDAGGVLDLATASGEVARVALVPFVSQRGIVGSEQLMRRDAAQHAGTYAERVARIVAALTEDFGSDAVNLVVGHLTVASGAPQLGGGERQNHTIFDYVVPPVAFPPNAHYVALGHLHLPHRVPGPAPIWYCGSPLHLDFGEADRGAKAVLLVEATATTPAQVEQVPLASGRRLRTLRGSLEQVLAARDEVGDDLLRVLLDEAPRPGLADEVRAALPETVDVAIARSEDDRANGDAAPALDLDALRASPVALFQEYLDELGIADPRIPRLFQRLLDEAQDSDRDADVRVQP